MVYSTCSIDPLENEAVVAHLLRCHEWLKLERIEMDTLLPELVYSCGLSEWDPKNGDSDEKSVRNIRESHIPPGDIPDEFADKVSEKYPRKEDREEEIIASLTNCVRIQPNQNDSGGFFFAVLRQTDSVGDARGLHTKPEWPFRERVPPVGDHGAPQTIDEITKEKISEEWGGWNGMNGRLWKRGRKIIESVEEAGKWLYDPPRFDSSGRQLPGGHWHPLKVRHVGRIALEGSKSHADRPKAELLMDSRVRPKKHVHEVDITLVTRLLEEGVIPVEDLSDQLRAERSGSVLLDVKWPTGTRLMPAWLGTGLRLLLKGEEIRVLKAQVGLNNEE